MSDLICSGDYPEQLLPLARSWREQGRKFCISPANIFEYNFIPMNYQGAQGAPRDLASWEIRTKDCFLPTKLTKEDIDQIAYYFGKDLEFDFAIMMTGTKCNLRCRFCLYHGDTGNVWQDRFSEQWLEPGLDVIKSRIDKLSAIGIKGLQLVPNGELFAYKEWEEMIRYAQSKGIAIKILFTNGVTLTENVIKKLAELNIETLSISINAYTFETWSKITGATNLDMFEVAHNAPLLSRKYNIKTEVSMVICEENIHEVESFIKYWKGKCDILKVVHEISSSDVYESENKVDNRFLPYYICGYLRRRLVISNNGCVLPCCAAVEFLNNDNSFNIPIVNIDDTPSDVIVNKMNEYYRNKSYATICRKCPYVRVINAGESKSEFFGFKGVKSGSFFFVDMN